MGLLQKACETYDSNAEMIGVLRESHEPLAPISHTLTQANIEIVIDVNGKFHSAAKVDKKEPKIIIPVTEESAGRTSSAISPHPLCEQLCYVAPYNEKKNERYVEQLGNWMHSEYNHPMLMPIYTYVTSATILQDLEKCDVISLNENKIPKEEKSLIRWRVLGLDPEACWLDRSLFDSFINWYQSQLASHETGFCMISGEYAPLAGQHPKGIIPINGNAKLISANDTSNFTFRGRFITATETATISYTATQKAHNALRWVIANQADKEGGRTFLCWNPKGASIPSIISPLCQYSSSISNTPVEYRKQLRQTLSGFQSNLPEDNSDIVIAAFDASTKGRLSLTYYNELRSSDFLQRLQAWDNICCWYNGKFGIQSPSLYQIVSFAYGTLRTDSKTQKETIEVDDKVLKQQIQGLVSCRIDQTPFPTELILALMHQVENLQLYRNRRSELLFVVCSAIRKYRYDRFKEELKMDLEREKKDRSYQYGRLLAVLDKIERDTFDNDEKRETNAIRMLSIFSHRPADTSRIIWESVYKAYFPQLPARARNYYQKLLGEIYEQLHSIPGSEQNTHLGDTYIMGYYLQRNELYKSHKTKETEDSSDERTEK